MTTYTKRQKEDKAYWLGFRLVCELGKVAPGYLRQAAKEAKKILADTKNCHKDDDKKCVRHPMYRGVRKPYNNCRGCWRVYNAKHETDKK